MEPFKIRRIKWISIGLPSDCHPFEIYCDPDPISSFNNKPEELEEASKSYPLILQLDFLQLFGVSIAIILRTDFESTTHLQ